MRSQYDIRVKQSGESDTSSSFMRVGLLFGSLALALGLVLVPVYMKHDNDRLMDTQYPAAPKGIVTAVGAHK
ncbi:MAG: hypothetical protein DU429_04170 [Candidatus Tokpelaia sp.]|uniref:hypothetical protein n=1 Tax=Candidatus Tokpelaia sp. TaxID=2233777 RepID=UPI0012398872|nr:hypothetical protein [Candidatus Tokpelaia sp.]KAA6204971.1 MAG: hypothetical protein DU430_06205 [Candidatus Tokpelaia sp.]KAA6207047.1 MAG: hypothetical protein DU429_04170 [Candidatus Tokpelaia sp.]KAA6405413.1 hypothetical protein DPQ22_04970 [Candidatus Tokpelaia sp.]